MTEPVQENPVPEEQKEENTSGRFMVKTPWNLDLLYGNDLFPDVTPDGVEMSYDEKEEAKKAAEQLHIRLLTKEV